MNSLKSSSSSSSSAVPSRREIRKKISLFDTNFKLESFQTPDPHLPQTERQPLRVTVQSDPPSLKPVGISVLFLQLWIALTGRQAARKTKWKTVMFHAHERGHVCTKQEWENFRRWSFVWIYFLHSFFVLYLIKITKTILLSYRRIV